MATLRVTLETITPLLMYGADQNEPELRGTSFRGILRYWLRAVLGAKHTNTANLYEAESKILGSTEKGSQINIRVQKPRSVQPAYDQWVLPEQTSRGSRPRYDAFPSGSEFRLLLSTHPLDASDVLAMESPLVKALFLMIYVGGLGKRARRGSGNLFVKDVKGYESETLPMRFFAQDRDELADYLLQMANFINATPLGQRPNFPIFAPDTCVMLLGNRAYPSVEEVLSNSGALWSLSGPYHHSGGIFGDARPRRSSAIHMRVAITNNGYVSQQTIFYSGNGAWSQMQQYINACRSDFDVIYGDYEGWGA
jgi:CRISPR type III-B/RAMP module RAMP protein Cmr1